MAKRSMVVSLIGRPNVGKSSLFNRLMKKASKAITHDKPGVTRDRHYGITSFDDDANEEALDAILVDTGGFYPDKIDVRGKNTEEENFNKFFNIMTDHAQMAIDESDLVLFVVDVREGALPFDKTIADYIRTKKKNFWLIVNKFDSEAQYGEEIDFYSLGIKTEDMYMVSAAHAYGINDLRENLHREMVHFDNQLLKNSEMGALQKGVTPREKVASRLALIGAPNAGKSTLLNKLVGAERALVSDIAGTTVDPIEGYFDLYFGNESKELDLGNKLEKHDGQLYKQYEAFRKNNSTVYKKMVDAYNLEEQAEKKNDGSYEYVDAELDDLVDEELIENESNEETVDRLYNAVFTEENTIENEAETTSEEPEEEGSYWRSLHIVDTAGIRRQKSVKGFIEEQSVYRSLRSIADSDIVIYMIDSTQGLGHQDRRLLDIALEKGKSVIVALNKVDLLSQVLKTEEDKKEWIENLRDSIPWLDYCDLLTISAKHGGGLKRLKAAIKKTVMIRNRPIPTGELNRYVFELLERNPVVVKQGGAKRFKVKYTSMIKSDPPTFLFFSNRSQGIPEHYKRYIKNGLRKGFVLDNTPLHLIFRTGGDLAKRMKNSKFKSDFKSLRD
jgi:GTP-binding protein